MAKKEKRTCDWKVAIRKRVKICGEPAPRRRELSVGRVTFVGDLCLEHDEDLRQMLLESGLRPVSRIHGKNRGGYVAHSGELFSGSEARPWLIKKGLAGPTGRLSAEAIEAYAEAH